MQVMPIKYRLIRQAEEKNRTKGRALNYFVGMQFTRFNCEEFGGLAELHA